MSEQVGYGSVDPADVAGANRGFWDGYASEYLAEHGDFLGEADLCWCPEGLRESEARLLGPLSGKNVIEIGCGAGQGSRWVASQGGRCVGLDLARGMLQNGLALGRSSGIHVPFVQADARHLPLANACADIAFSAFGALPFVPDAEAIHHEIRRILKPGGTWVFSVSHPIRWAFPDDGSQAGLTVRRSYFDRRPYREVDSSGRLVYSEHHRTLGDHVREVRSAGLTIERMIEPEWQAGEALWGGWSRLRGEQIPGSLIVVASSPS